MGLVTHPLYVVASQQFRFCQLLLQTAIPDIAYDVNYRRK